MEFNYELKIPKDRIAVLIGKEGAVKEELELLTGINIDIDSKEGDVKLKGENSLNLYALKEVILGISRGFNPDIAQLLLKQDYVLDIIPLLDYIKNKNHLERIKGRVIGAKGKSRQTIESLTDTFISVYGKTIAIIGRSENVVSAKQAVESLLQGSPHSNVYRFLEKNRVRLKQRELEDW
ncbi:MAG: KH domain-containing protein [Candidatus Woesearchaeota archaeon]